MVIPQCILCWSNTNNTELRYWVLVYTLWKVFKISNLIREILFSGEKTRKLIKGGLPINARVRGTKIFFKKKLSSSGWGEGAFIQDLRVHDLSNPNFLYYYVCLQENKCFFMSIFINHSNKFRIFQCTFCKTCLYDAIAFSFFFL